MTFNDDDDDDVLEDAQLMLGGEAVSPDRYHSRMHLQDFVQSDGPSRTPAAVPPFDVLVRRYSHYYVSHT